MSTDVTGAAEPVDARRSALRLASGVTACFGLVEALGWDATFLAPMLAAQLLTTMRQPPGPAQGLALVLLVGLSAGAVLAVTASLLSQPVPLILTLALLLCLSFYAHRRGAPNGATLAVQIAAVSLPVLAVVSPDAARDFAGALVSAAVVAVLTVWVAFAAFPANTADGGIPTAADDLAILDPPEAAREALLNTLVLLPVLTGFVLVASEPAVVVLVVIVNLLRQHDPRQGQRAALGLILANLIGGLAAAAVHSVVALNETFPVFVAACLAATLAFAGRIVTAGPAAPIPVIALSTFILLLGLGLTPLPGGSGEAFVSRLGNVVWACTYTVGAVSLLEPRRVRHRST